MKRLPKQRNIEFVLHDQHLKKEMCIYVILFGEKFYIGRTIDLTRRFAQHKRTFNRLLNAAIHRGEQAYAPSFRAVVDFLIVNPHIDTADMYVLELCTSLEESIREELSWLEAVRTHALNWYCLNPPVPNNEPIKHEDIQWEWEIEIYMQWLPPMPAKSEDLNQDDSCDL